MVHNTLVNMLRNLAQFYHSSEMHKRSLSKANTKTLPLVGRCSLLSSFKTNSMSKDILIELLEELSALNDLLNRTSSTSVKDSLKNNLKVIRLFLYRSSKCNFFFFLFIQVLYVF